MTERIWAPWRVQYIEELNNDGCVFCDATNCAPHHKNQQRILAERNNEFVIINKYPYTFGHLLVCPTRHVSRLDQLSATEQESFFRMVCDAQQALGTAISPHGFNLGMNQGKNAGAGIADHLHMHIVPRWQGDTNFMPVTADTMVMPAHLDKVMEMLAPAFQPLKATGETTTSAKWESNE